jgi:hypothetical protein
MCRNQGTDETFQIHRTVASFEWKKMTQRSNSPSMHEDEMFLFLKALGCTGLVDAKHLCQGTNADTSRHGRVKSGARPGAFQFLTPSPTIFDRFLKQIASPSLIVSCG